MCSRNGTLINSEVHNNSLALQFAQLTCIALHVTQVNVDDAGFYNFFLWNLQCFCLGLTCVFHTFNNDIIKVLGAYCIGICIVEAGSYGCKTFHIVFVVQRIEYQIVVELLEQGEISGCRIRCCEYIVYFHILFIVIEQRGQAVFEISWLILLLRNVASKSSTFF